MPISMFVCLFLASPKLQSETPYPLKQFSSLDVICRIITRGSVVKTKQSGQVTFLCFMNILMVFSNEVSLRGKII